MFLDDSEYLSKAFLVDFGLFLDDSGVSVQTDPESPLSPPPLLRESQISVSEDPQKILRASREKKTHENPLFPLRKP